jgi:cell division transport system permease protein
VTVRKEPIAMASFRRFGFHAKEAFFGITSTSVMNLATVTTVALSLFILGMFLLFLRNLNIFLDDLRNQYQITLFLETSMTVEQRTSILDELKKNLFVEDITFIPKEDALNSIRDELNNAGSTLPELDKNPLPDTIEMYVKETAPYEELLMECSKIKGVAEVSRGQEWVGKVMQIVRLVRLIGLTLVLILGTASLLIVANTIKLAVYARRQEIEIMKLVGATNWFVRIPFLIEGFLQGLIGAIIAVVILMAGYHWMAGEIHRIAPFLQIIRDTGELTKLSLQIMLLGVVLGLLGSLLSLRRIMV